MFKVKREPVQSISGRFLKEPAARDFSYSRSVLERWIGIVAVLNLAMIAILSGRPSFSNASRPIRGITNPVLAIEVARNIAEVDAILGDAPSPDREAMRLKQYADFGFISAYGTLFVLMGLFLMRQGRAIAIAAATMGVAAALLDVVENIGTLRLVNTDLAHTTQGMIDAVRYPSLTKWALAALATGILAILLFQLNRVGPRIVSVLNLAAAALVLYGLYDNVFLGWAGAPTLGGFLGLAILYFRPRRRIHAIAGPDRQERLG